MKQWITEQTKFSNKNANLLTNLIGEARGEEDNWLEGGLGGD